MPITAVCPVCMTSYRVDASLLGKPMRCPNGRCREVFTVSEEPPAAKKEVPFAIPMDDAAGPQSGSVGDMIPVLPAEAVAPPAPAPAPPPKGNHVGDMLPLVEAEAVAPPDPAAEPSWKQAPPPRRTSGNGARLAPPAEAKKVEPAPVRRRARVDAPEPSPAADQKEAPREVPPGMWEPPPVRRSPNGEPPPADAGQIPLVEPPADHLPAEETHAPVPAHARRLWLIVGTFVLIAVAVLGVGGFLVWQIVGITESGLLAQAETAYKAGQYGAAEGFYKQLAEKFPTSDKIDTYKFMQLLGGLRNQAGAANPSVPEMCDHLDSFLTARAEQNTQLHDRTPDLIEVLVALAEKYRDHLGEPEDLDGTLKDVDRLRQSFARVQGLNEEAAAAAEKRFNAPLNQATQVVAGVRQRREAVARLQEAPKNRSPAEAVVEFHHRLRQETVLVPDIGKRPEVVQLRDKLYADHLASIVYTDANNDIGTDAPDDDETSILVDPRLNGKGEDVKPPPGDPVVLALARGVLYALSRSTGRAQWAMRVGVDTTQLPVRVPATDVSPERILVLAADAKTLTALDSGGNPLWTYHLTQPCLGRPLVLKEENKETRRAFLATYDGLVHEIELSKGTLLGVYHLGQPLSVGGVQQPGTDLLYFPADEFCVYVLDAANHRCQAVLYTRHPAGSLRGEPLIVNPDPATPNGYLILNQTQGLDAMQLRVYPLPARDRDAEPLALIPSPRVAGWTWFPPYYDSEKVVLLSDRGELGLFGVRQKLNPKDPDLFPLTPRGVKLDEWLKPATMQRSRSEVVEVQGDDFWVLAHGMLDRLRLGLNHADGPKASPVWDTPRELGSPLHASQVEEDRRKGTATLFLVTQPLQQQTCLATAVDDDKGDVLWQRQLGLVCQGEPLPLQPPGAAGPPVLLALDQGGGLFAFDPLRHPRLGEDRWVSAGKAVAAAVTDNPDAPPVLLPGPDARSAYEIAFAGESKDLVIRFVEFGKGRELKATERKVPLRFPPAGTPAVAGSMLILPLSNGKLARLALPLEDKPRIVEGPDWRSRRAPPDARGRVVALGGDEFLAGDGLHGLNRWRWAGDKEWGALPKGEHTAPNFDLKDRRVAADPVALPAAAEGEAPRVCLADSVGDVYLLAAARDGKMTLRRKWSLGGAVTAGPFLQRQADGAVRIGCVVERRQLVWLDPERDKALWTYPPQPGASLVGRPQMVGDLVVVADQRGRIVGLNPETGVPAGPGYTLQGSMAAAASPVLFGDRLFTPLSDGTILLPPLRRLRHPLDGFPPLTW